MPIRFASMSSTLSTPKAEIREPGAAGPAVGGRFRPVAHDVVADRVDIGDVVGGEPAHAGVHDRRAGEGAGLILEDTLGGGDRAVLLDSDLDPHRSAGGGAG